MDNMTRTPRKPALLLATVVAVTALTACLPPRPAPIPRPVAKPTAPVVKPTVPVVKLPAVPAPIAPRPVDVQLSARAVRVNGTPRVTADVTATHPSGQVRIEWTLTGVDGRSVTGTGPIDVAVVPGVHQLWVQARANDGGSGTAIAEVIAPPTSGELRAVEAELLDLVNQARSLRGAPALSLDNTLATGARAWSGTMQTSGFAHDIDFLTDLGGFTSAGEVIHQGRYSFDRAAAQAFDSWRWSPPHWAQLMNPKYRLAGFGISALPVASLGPTALHFMTTGRLALG